MSIVKNRRATLEVYFVPGSMAGRKEATWVMKEDGTLEKQNIFLQLWDTQRPETALHERNGHIFYRVDFFDGLPLDQRVAEAAKKFKGTHSRNTNGYEDTASFEILRKDELIRYLEYLAEEG